MGESTGIQWTTHSFNPWWGCTKVSHGCDHCYAEAFDKRVGGDHWGPGKPRRLVKDWSGPRKWNALAKKDGKPHWTFCASMADVFDNEAPEEWRDRLWELVRECRHLHWQFLTKRIGNVAKMLPPDWRENFGHCGLMISVVNQEEADRDVPKLLATHAAWRGVSYEPALGPVDFRQWLSAYGCGCGWGGDSPLDYCNDCGWRGHGEGEIGDAECPDCKRELSDYNACPECDGHDGDGMSFGPNAARLNWLICGGESGPNARYTPRSVFRSTRDQCAAAGVPYFGEQWGEWIDADEWLAELLRSGWRIDRALSTPLNFDDAAWLSRACGRNRFEHLSDGSTMIRVGKHAAGRLLDGVEHNGMPEVR